jgi:ABC-type uncharacterized transport system fused permease/ATPase subunit
MTHAVNFKPKKIDFYLWQLFKNYWNNTETLMNVLLVTVIALTGALQVGSLLALNEWNKLFFDAVQAYDTSTFYTLGISFIVIVLVISTAVALNNYFVGV